MNINNKMNKNNNVIYSFSFGENNENVYVGSSINFKKRKFSHKSSCFNPNSNEYNKYAYRKIRENNINFDDIAWVILDSNVALEELHKIEDLWISVLDSNLNRKLNLGISKKSYNWEKTIKNCECGSIYSNRNKWRHFNTKKHLRFNNLII